MSGDRGETFAVEAGSMAPGGRCFSRLDDGTPLFLAGAAPGETSPPRPRFTGGFPQ